MLEVKSVLWQVKMSAVQKGLFQTMMLYCCAFSALFVLISVTVSPTGSRMAIKGREV